jgi:protease-4
MATFGSFPPDNGDNANNASPSDLQWERSVLKDLAFAAIKEQRAKRRWGLVFKGFIGLYLIALLVIAYSPTHLPAELGEHTALVEVAGVIAADAEANADNIVTGIRDAFDNPDAKGLILRMNTPGGSPVQSGIINDEIQRLRPTRPDFPIYAVIQDVCASGGYYVAVAADKIYADKASIVGSIGVRMDSFGFTDLIDKVGVERRSLTAGEHKAFLDPFLPMKEQDIAHAHQMLDVIHQQFIDVVKQGRGDRLSDNDELFSGLFWAGEQAVDLGLVDGLANSSTVARDIIGAENIIDYTPRPNYLDLFTGKLGAMMSQTLNASTHWSMK